MLNPIAGTDDTIIIINFLLDAQKINKLINIIIPLTGRFVKSRIARTGFDILTVDSSVSELESPANRFRIGKSGTLRTSSRMMSAAVVFITVATTTCRWRSNRRR